MVIDCISFKKICQTTPKKYGGQFFFWIFYTNTGLENFFETNIFYYFGIKSTQEIRFSSSKVAY